MAWSCLVLSQVAETRSLLCYRLGAILGAKYNQTYGEMTKVYIYRVV